MSPTRNPRAIALALFAAACTSVGPDYHEPELLLPPDWSAPREAGLALGIAAEAPFWRLFADPALEDLVERALQRNKDLAAAFARLDSSRAAYGGATADRWPSLDARGSYEHREDSKNTPFGAFIPKTDIHTLAFDASWEIDLWGRVRRSVEAASRDLEASTADVEAAALSVAAEVARGYVDLLAAVRRLAIARENLQLQERTVELVRARLAAGLVGERDVAQALTNVETTRSRLPLLEAAATVAQNRLAVLLGQAPGTVVVATGGDLPHLAAPLATGQPTDLLRRRPDVRAAERRLAAEVARVGIAEADRYPRFSLAGTLGLSSNGPEQLFEADSLVSAIGPSVRWNLFDGGRLKNRVRALEASAEAAQRTYEQTVLRAIEEAENAMTQFVREQQRRTALARAAAEAKRAVDLAQTQYREGLSDFQAVLDSERIAATIDDDLATSDAAVATDLIALCKALGGGMAAPAPPAADGD